MRSSGCEDGLTPAPEDLRRMGVERQHDQRKGLEARVARARRRARRGAPGGRRRNCRSRRGWSRVPASEMAPSTRCVSRLNGSRFGKASRAGFYYGARLRATVLGQVSRLPRRRLRRRERPGPMTPEQATAEARKAELRPVYLVHGEERFLSSIVMTELRKAVLGGLDLGLNEDHFDASTADADAVLSAARTLPMMAKKAPGRGALSRKVGAQRGSQARR